MKLDSGQKNILNLIDKAKKDDKGWATASEVVFNGLVKHMPAELVETNPQERKARLTEEGNSVLRAMKWL